MKKEQDRLEKLKREQFKITELNKQLEKVEDKLEKIGYQDDSVIKVEKNEEFGGKSSKMVGLMQFTKCLVNTTFTPNFVCFSVYIKLFLT